eukprot:GGOE01019013.1.p1 GENE.GGOE01019013.1~~GGOE01019013.1.p1  ORF type:complete len:363 (-),score=102.94 GGOE01019013.1:436-1392(-)
MTTTYSIQWTKKSITNVVKHWDDLGSSQPAKEGCVLLHQEMNVTVALKTKKDGHAECILLFRVMANCAGKEKRYDTLELDLSKFARSTEQLDTRVVGAKCSIALSIRPTAEVAASADGLAHSLQSSDEGSHISNQCSRSTSQRLSVTSLRGELHAAQQSLGQMHNDLATPGHEVTTQMIQQREDEIRALQEELERLLVVENAKRWREQEVAELQAELDRTLRSDAAVAQVLKNYQQEKALETAAAQAEQDLEAAKAAARQAHETRVQQLHAEVSEQHEGSSQAKVSQVEELERELAELEATRPSPREDAKACSGCIIS